MGSSPVPLISPSAARGPCTHSEPSAPWESGVPEGRPLPCPPGAPHPPTGKCHPAVIHLVYEVRQLLSTSHMGGTGASTFCRGEPHSGGSGRLGGRRAVRRWRRGQREALSSVGLGKAYGVEPGGRHGGRAAGHQDPRPSSPNPCCRCPTRKGRPACLSCPPPLPHGFAPTCRLCSQEMRPARRGAHGTTHVFTSFPGSPRW